LKFHIHNNNTHDTHLQAKEKYFTIPYVKSISESFLSLIMKFHCKLAFTIPNTLKGFIRTGKDQLDKFLNQNTIYKISCGDCDASYVGQTKR